MASLNTSTNGPSIKSSYQGVLNGSFSANSNSPTFGIWALFSVSTPLVNAFQPDRGGKESILKVQSTGEGELEEMIEEFSEGRIQFAFLKIKDSNSSLPKHVLIGWCGEGVPERTKGYFTSHLAAVSKIFQGYHIQITARSDRDLTPETIVKKVADASGAKYSRGGDLKPSSGPPTLASKPVFTPQSSGPGNYNHITGSRIRGSQNEITDDDGWGADAPQVTRSQLEKVAPAYKPTKVNMKELIKQKSTPIYSNGDENINENSDVVKGGYQPVGKVDIAAIRAQARDHRDDRPTAVKGAYEPVGKVDIAAIRAKAQKPTRDNYSPVSANDSSNDQESTRMTLAERSAAFQKSERLTTLPKPKVLNKFGSAASNFTGTRAPQPIGFAPASFVPPPVGTASKTFADEGGKTPAQIWQEKKERERGLSGASSIQTSQTSPTNLSKSNVGNEWKSGYTGKSWAPVSTNPTGRSGTGSIDNQHIDDQEQEKESHFSTAGGIGALRNQFQGGLPIRTSTAPLTNIDQRSPTPPVVNTSTRPSQPVAPPPFPARSPSPDSPQPEASPIRVAMPVPRHREPEVDISEKLESPIRNDVFNDSKNDYNEGGKDNSTHSDVVTSEIARLDIHEVPTEKLDPSVCGKCALIQYDYEIAEDNEIELIEGEYVTNIEMVDTDWWMGMNSKGQTGLFPRNYVELVDEISGPSGGQPDEPEALNAIARYNYEAAEDNELSFEEEAIITGVEFPDKDWWYGSCNGKSGLFPANYVDIIKE